jgi:hypothetical protein
MGTNNPSLAASAEAMRSSMSGAAGMASAAGGVAAALERASQQHQQLQQQQVQQAKEEDADYWKEVKGGAQPYQPFTETKDDSGLVKRSPNPAPGPGPVRTFPISGKQLYYPTEGERNAGKDKQQSFTDMMSALDHGGRAASPPATILQGGAAPAMDDPSRVVNPPGGRPMYIPTDDEKATLKSAQAVKSKQALDALSQMPIPADVGDALGLKPGATGTFGDIIRAHHEAFPDKPATSQTLIPGYTGPKGGPIQRDAKTGATSEVEMPAGSKASLTPAQQEIKARAGERAQDRSDAQGAATEAKAQKARDDGQKQLDVLQAQEQAQHALRIAYGTDAADGKPFVDPQTKQTYTMNAGRRVYNRQQLDKATAAVGSLQDKQRKIEARIGGQPAAASQGSAVAPEVRAQPAAGGGQAGKPVPQAPVPQTPKFKVGDSVMHGNRAAKVVGFNPDGSAKIQYQ